MVGWDGGNRCVGYEAEEMKVLRRQASKDMGSGEGGDGKRRTSARGEGKCEGGQRARGAVEVWGRCTG